MAVRSRPKRETGRPHQWPETLAPALALAPLADVRSSTRSNAQPGPSRRKLAWPSSTGNLASVGSAGAACSTICLVTVAEGIASPDADSTRGEVIDHCRDRWHISRRQAQHDVAQVEPGTGVGQLALAQADDGDDRAAAAARLRDLRRQEFGQCRESQRIRTQFDARVEVLALVERTLQPHVELQARIERLRQRRAALHDDEVVVAPQFALQHVQFQRRSTRLQVTIDDRHVGDDEPTGGQPVQVERWPVRGSLCPARAAGCGHPRDARWSRAAPRC